MVGPVPLGELGHDDGSTDRLRPGSVLHAVPQQQLPGKALLCPGEERSDVARRGDRRAMASIRWRR